MWLSVATRRYGVEGDDGSAVCRGGQRDVAGRTCALEPLGEERRIDGRL